MKIFRIILLPFSLLYAVIIFARNLLYDSSVLPSTSFDIGVISVGNLAFGGTGKTPHIEYLIRLLLNNKKTAVLSRGYRRKTTGYIFADENCNASIIGDEPFQIYSKFKSQAAVAVSENRVLGIPYLLMDAPQTEIILLDDAFQHRAVKPGLNILLSDYNRMFTSDFIAPVGNLREYRSAYKRANIIVVSKCPNTFSQQQANNIIKNIKPLAQQKVFFSYQVYDNLIPVFAAQNAIGYNNNFSVLLFAGIAHINSLNEYIKSKFNMVETIHFTDHQTYGSKEIEKILFCFNSIASNKKIIITTEKDAVKLHDDFTKKQLENLPIFYLPLQTEFFTWCKADFDNTILEFTNSAG